MASNTPSDQTNPKDLLGVLKVSLGLVPAAGKIYAAVAMADGAKKYGPYNWRDKKVKLSVYLDAIERHLLAYRDGEDCASDSKLPHLAHIIACGCILADAIEGDFLVDDRPLPGPGPKTLDKFKKEAPQQPAPAVPTTAQPQSVSDRVVPSGFRYLDSMEIVQCADYYWDAHSTRWQLTGEPGRIAGNWLVYIRKI